MAGAQLAVRAARQNAGCRGHHLMRQLSKGHTTAADRRWGISQATGPGTHVSSAARNQ